MAEGQISLDRPCLVDLKAGLTGFGQRFPRFHGDPGLDIGLTEKSRRLIAPLIAADAWKCFFPVSAIFIALNLLSRIADRHGGTRSRIGVCLLSTVGNMISGRNRQETFWR